MKKIVLIIGFMLGCVVNAFSQDYIKFSETPEKSLKPARQYYNYKIAYKASAKSTIYLELKKGDSLVGNGVYDVIKANEKIVATDIVIFPKVSKIAPGNDYSYNLYMYQGGRNDWTRKVCKTIVVDSVKVTSSGKN